MDKRYRAAPFLFLQMKQILLLFTVLALVQSCVSTKLPTHKTQWTTSGPSEKQPIHFDSLSKVNYQLERDDKNLYLHLSTSDLAAQMRIMRFGMSIWLDATAKKKSKVGFEYPLAPPDSVAGQMMGRGMRGGGRGGNRPEGRAGRGGGKAGPPSPEEMQKRMLARIYKRFNEKPKELIQIGFDKNDKRKQKFTLGQENGSDILVDLEIINDTELHYFAVIPIKKIFEEESPTLMSIGLVSGSLDMDMSMMPPAEGNDRRARMMEQMTTPIEIWFNADLKKED